MDVTAAAARLTALVQELSRARVADLVSAPGRLRDAVLELRDAIELVRGFAGSTRDLLDRFPRGETLPGASRRRAPARLAGSELPGRERRPELARRKKQQKKRKKAASRVAPGREREAVAPRTRPAAPLARTRRRRTKEPTAAAVRQAPSGASRVRPAAATRKSSPARPPEDSRIASRITAPLRNLGRDARAALGEEE